MRAPKRDVAVFLTHYFDAEVERRFLKLQRECSESADVVALAEAGTAVPEALLPCAQFFDFSALRGRAKSVIGDRVVPGNAHLPALDYFHRFPDYRHYWFVEYDVVYTGDWGRFMGSFEDDDSDLLASHLRSIADDPDWHWRHTVSTDEGALPDDRFLTAFLPVHRISARGLAAVETKVRNGWVGHFEALVPSSLADHGFPIADFGGSGAWTPKDRIHRHYLDWPGPYDAGTIRHQPPVTSMLIKNMLYHPCKTSQTPVQGGSTESKKTVLPLRRDARILISYWLKVMQLAVLSRLRSARH